MSLVTKASSPNVKMRNQMLLDNKSDLKKYFCYLFLWSQNKKKKNYDHELECDSYTC